jgi:three-Cys-motif partner protein
VARDIHKLPFDEGTRAKLAIFRDYIRQWLPVFIAKREIIWSTINIYDFFSGPGSDCHGTQGTPVIILEELAPFLEEIKAKNLTVNLYFNEYDATKAGLLIKKIEGYRGGPYNIVVESLDFKESFERQYPLMRKPHCANLLFLDQNGIKHITEDVFHKIVALKTTDFLFFVSSSTVKRFSDHPSIAQHIKLNTEDVEKTPYHKIHRLVTDYYRSLIPKEKSYFLASFSLKKNAGLYGLIFGSAHVLGIEKFLNTCWTIDPDRGEANFDIDGDNLRPGQGDLFTGEVAKPKKVDLFEQELRAKIITSEFSNDREIYLFTIMNGFTPAHARKVLSRLVLEKKVKKGRWNLTSKVCLKNSPLTKIEKL